LVDMIFSVRVVYPQELTLKSGTDEGVHFSNLSSGRGRIEGYMCGL